MYHLMQTTKTQHGYQYHNIAIAKISSNIWSCAASECDNIFIYRPAVVRCMFIVRFRQNSVCG